jgi:hypothetical protein
MDYRNLFGIAAIILSAAVFLQSLKSANALPQGPNISSGSNPIDQGQGNCNGSTIFTNNSSQSFIITDISKSYVDSYEIYLESNGQTIWNGRGNFNFRSGLQIAPGSSVTCIGGYSVSISGYYAH